MFLERGESGELVLISEFMKGSVHNYELLSLDAVPLSGCCFDIWLPSVTVQFTPQIGLWNECFCLGSNSVNGTFPTNEGLPNDVGLKATVWLRSTSG